MPDRPFVYIAALRRTGSTVLSELLTSFPQSFIFREPSLGRGKFELKPDDVERFASLGVDLDAFARRWTAWSRRRRVIAAFRDELSPRLPASIEQIGVKEIFHRGWERYARAYPDMRVVVLGRDPRDIYLSLVDRRSAGVGLIAGQPFSPAAVAASLNAEFERQRHLASRFDALRVRYEDLCRDEGLAAQVLAFVDSPLPAPGRAGQFNASNPQREAEAAVHGGSVTTRRTERWRTVEDPDLVAQVAEVASLMREYMAYWGYGQ